MTNDLELSGAFPRQQAWEVITAIFDSHSQQAKSGPPHTQSYTDRALWLVSLNIYLLSQSISLRDWPG